MGAVVIAAQSAPATPSAGFGSLYADTSDSTIWAKNDAGLYVGSRYVARTTQIASHSADTYYQGITLPNFGMQAGMAVRFTFPVTKGAGTAAPVFALRLGAAGTTADTARLSITLGAQTAVADTGFVTCLYTVRSVGASGVIQGAVWLQHNLAATGLATTPAGFSAVQGTGAGFDNSAVGGQILGLSVNPGAAGAWVVAQVLVELMVK